MHRKNNFDFLRLLFATFVIITHSYTLTGIVACDWICKIADGQTNFSSLGVDGFFIISGYLIFQSMERSDNVYDYYWKRFLRLFPALFVVLLLTVVLVPFVYEGNIPYLHNKSLWMYLPDNLTLFRFQSGIDGVFESTPYKSSVNASLWTIRYEFAMYILLSFFIAFRKHKKMIKAILFSLFIFLLIENIFFSEQIGKYGFILNAKLLVGLGVYFIAGSVLSTLHFESIQYKNLWIICTLLLLVAAIYFHFYEYTKFILLPVAVILIGSSATPVLRNIGSYIGDLSYGIYIIAFPVQQTLMYYFKLNYLELMLCSFIIASFSAYFSWHFIEKKALKLKKLRPIAVWRQPGLRAKVQ